MSDEDRAQALELRMWEQANSGKGGQFKTYQPDEDGYGPEFCAVEICGAVMPAARRAHGFHICVDCKSLQENRQKHRVH